MFGLSVGCNECGSQSEAVEGAESCGLALHGHTGSYQSNALALIFPGREIYSSTSCHGTSSVQGTARHRYTAGNDGVPSPQKVTGLPDHVANCAAQRSTG